MKHAPRRLAPWLLLLVAAPVGAAFLTPGPSADPVGATKPNRYIGAEKCKSCHNDPATGDQYGAWKEMKHANAFEALGTERAKEVAAAQGVADPQTDAACLQCHVTAYGESEDLLKRGFDPKLGVQCETCHGPGEAHQKARLVAAMGGGEDEGFGEGFGEEEGAGYTELPEGEIVASPAPEVCAECHTKESPTYQPFCFWRHREKVSHLNPAKPRTQEELDARLVCKHEEGTDCQYEHELKDCAVPKGSLEEDG